MIKEYLLQQIKTLLEKFPDGVNLSPLEILSLYLLQLHKDEAAESDFINKDVVTIAIENAISYLKEYNYNVPVKTDTVMESLIKKKALLFSATERNSYYLSELATSIINGLFSKDLETISDVESNLNTLYITLKNLENSQPHEILNFFRHAFYDLVIRIDKKILQIKEEILNIKSAIKESIRRGDEDTFGLFLNQITRIRDLLREISLSLSRYSAYNQILYYMNALEKKCNDDNEIVESIHRAYRKLFGIKNELENTLTDVTEFINRHVSLITSQIRISSLDNILQFQKKLLMFFTIKPILLRKPKRQKVKEFRYRWKTETRKPIIISEENIVTEEEIDFFEKEEIEKIINHLMEMLLNNETISFVYEILKFPLVESNLPKYYNKILFEISDKIDILIDDAEFHYRDCYVSDIKISLKAKKDAGKSG